MSLKGRDDMAVIKFPYGEEIIPFDIPEDRLKAVLVSKLHDYKAEKGQAGLVREALANPTGSPGLRELAKGKKNITIIASDHTRPVPSKVIIPQLLREIREGNPEAKITILIATGCHRGTTKEELINKFGEDIVRNEHIHIHDCDDTRNMVNIGRLPSGGELIINKIAYEADLLVSEGFIEPHFFAGYSGGRKSVLPGIASRITVLANHCSEFIDDMHCRTGVLKDNPMHEDMLWAARRAKLAFIVNVVLNSEKEVIYAVAGDMEAAHAKGCEFLSGLCRAEAVAADIAIATNGGYPLDQNIYQAVKGMTAAEATVKKDGVIIMLARSEDGHGSEGFYNMISGEADIHKTMRRILERGRNQTEPDQWEAQVLLRVLQHATLIYISDVPDEIVRGFHMIPAHSIEEALKRAEDILKNKKATITAIPDGISVIVT